MTMYYTLHIQVCSDSIFGAHDDIIFIAMKMMSSCALVLICIMADQHDDAVLQSDSAICPTQFSCRLLIYHAHSNYPNGQKLLSFGVN